MPGIERVLRANRYRHAVWLRRMVWLRGSLGSAPLLATLLLATLQLAACATTEPPVSAQLGEAFSLSSALANREQTVTSLQTAAIMEYTGGGEHFKAREQIAVRRPASLRVDALSPGGVALVVVADGGHVAIFNPAKNTLMEGAANAATLNRFARIPMTPEAAVRLLLALAPDSSMLAFRPASMTDQGSTRILTYHQPGGLTDELGFSHDQLVMVRETAADGGVNYEVDYADYRPTANTIVFPNAIEARFPRNGAIVKLTYQAPVLDAEIADSTFTLTPGPGTRQMNLGLATPSILDARG